MSTVKIVTDSTADLSAETLRKYGISVVPLKVIFGEEAFLDGVEISTDQFYDRLEKEFSTTSQPSPGEFEKVYRPLQEEGAEVVSIHISTHLSGTFQSALMAKANLDYADLEVIDSGFTSWVMGMMVILAARAARGGKSKEEIVRLVLSMKKEMQAYFTLDSLEYVKRGGRIGKAQVFLGMLLNIKPILTCIDGTINPFDRVRSRMGAIRRMVDEMSKKFGDRKLFVCFAHARNFESFELLKEYALKKLDCIEVFEARVGSVIGTHSGPTIFGLACVPAVTEV